MHSRAPTRTNGRVPAGSVRSLRSHVLRADARLAVRLVSAIVLATVLARVSPPFDAIVDTTVEAPIETLPDALRSGDVWVAGLDAPLYEHAVDVAVGTLTWVPVAAAVFGVAAVTAALCFRC